MTERPARRLPGRVNRRHAAHPTRPWPTAARPRPTSWPRRCNAPASVLLKRAPDAAALASHGAHAVPACRGPQRGLDVAGPRTTRGPRNSSSASHLPSHQYLPSPGLLGSPPDNSAVVPTTSVRRYRQLLPGARDDSPGTEGVHTRCRTDRGRRMSQAALDRLAGRVSQASGRPAPVSGLHVHAVASPLMSTTRSGRPSPLVWIQPRPCTWPARVSASACSDGASVWW